MRYRKDHKSKTKAKIVETASKAFRERGPSGLSVADIMTAAGLTHGGFYAHFSCRNELVADAFDAGIEDLIGRWTKLTSESEDGDCYSAVVTNYLSSVHRDNPGRGCPLPTYCAEIGQSGKELKQTFSRQLSRVTDIFAACALGSSTPDSRNRSLSTIATLIGAILLARAVQDKKTSDEILAATKRFLLEHHEAVDA